jgi:hypothetical protein
MDLRPSLRNSIDVALMLALTLAPLSLLWAIPDSSKPRNLPRPEAVLRCLKGTCFLLAQESSVLMKLPVLRPVRGYFLDTVLTMDKNSELEIIFPDKSKLILRNVSLLKIQKGRGSVLRELERGSEPLTAEQGPNTVEQQAPQSIIYVANLPVEILYPLAGSEIIPESFPTQLQISFRIAAQLQTSEDSSDTDFSTWTAYLLRDGEVPLSLGDILFRESQIPRHYSAEFRVEEPGNYLLVPKGLDPSVSQNGFRLKLGDRAELGSRILDLLDNYDDLKKKPLEFRTD